MAVINKRMLNANEASEYLSISVTKLYSWVKRGKIPEPADYDETIRCFRVLRKAMERRNGEPGYAINVPSPESENNGLIAGIHSF